MGDESQGNEKVRKGATNARKWVKHSELLRDTAGYEPNKIIKQ
jgi:hypothetical protein